MSAILLNIQKERPATTATWWPCAAFLALLLATGVIEAPAAQSTNTISPTDFAAFKIVTERNIFNTKRSAAYKPSTQQQTSRRARTESFALVGTMSYDKGPFAFFDGSGSEFRKVLKADDSIAGFKVKAIEPSAVKLASPTNEIDLLVGMQMQREEGGEWKMSQRPESLDTSASRRESSRSTPPSVRQQASAGADGNPDRPPGGFSAGDLIGLLQEFGGSNGAGPVPGRQIMVLTNSPQSAPATGNEADILEVLRRRREQE